MRAIYTHTWIPNVRQIREKLFIGLRCPRLHEHNSGAHDPGRMVPRFDDEDVACFCAVTAADRAAADHSGRWHVGIHDEAFGLAAQPDEDFGVSKRAIVTVFVLLLLGWHRWVIKCVAASELEASQDQTLRESNMQSNILSEQLL